MTHLPLPPPYHLKHTVGLGTKHPAPSPDLRPLSAWLKSSFTPVPTVHRSLFRPPTPLPIIPRARTLPILFIQNNCFKYNLRTPPSTSVCLLFLPPRPPTPPHGHSLGVLGGAGKCLGLWRDQGTVLETDTTMGPCFNLGKGGDKQVPSNTKSYDKDG